jgi:hypothetical protein
MMVVKTVSMTVEKMASMWVVPTVVRWVEWKAAR